jgi:hypothetical protein
MWGKRQPEPQRRPHPDARIEVQLQRIRSLRLAVERKEELLAETQQQLIDLRDYTARHPGSENHHRRLSLIGTLLDDLKDLDAEVARLHDDIAGRCDALSDTDLAYLDAYYPFVRD